ncbi:MAG TPA: VOC family protein [Candidatus Tumulicola sp.]|jgi:catechol 2,3-dioxygenase-like lactoylglutathione lyase family enzyme
MERVTGIGGFFFRCADPIASARWYREHLGIETGGEGESGVWEQAAGPTVFAPFASDSDYFPERNVWMLNLRVANLDAMAAQLRAAGIQVDVAPDESYGKFARIADPDGNPIELWESTE